MIDIIYIILGLTLIFIGVKIMKNAIVGLKRCKRAEALMKSGFYEEAMRVLRERV